MATDYDQTASQLEAEANTGSWNTPLKTLWELIESYQELVVRDPELTSKLELAFRVGSYLIPSRFGGSWEVSEFAYSLSNLYALLNDFIITRKCPAASQISKASRDQQVLLWCLSILDTIEVAVEMMTQRLFREPGKWGIVILMQLFKTVLRCLLVYKLHYGVLRTPAVPPPDRKQAQSIGSAAQREDSQPQAWRAPRTGKIIRSIHSDPSVPYSQLQYSVSPSRLVTMDTSSLIAETLYLARPLVHIFSMFVFQQNSWKPWLLALGMDLASLQLHNKLLRSNSAEKSEIMRRRVVMLLYLLRSPFYNKFTKKLLVDFLRWLSTTLPLLHFIVDPLLTYLPVWQQVYSYNWMS